MSKQNVQNEIKAFKAKRYSAFYMELTRRLMSTEVLSPAVMHKMLKLVEKRDLRKQQLEFLWKKSILVYLYNNPPKPVQDHAPDPQDVWQSVKGFEYYREHLHYRELHRDDFPADEKDNDFSADEKGSDFPDVPDSVMQNINKTVYDTIGNDDVTYQLIFSFYVGLEFDRLEDLNKLSLTQFYKIRNFVPLILQGKTSVTEIQKLGPKKIEFLIDFSAIIFQCPFSVAEFIKWVRNKPRKDIDERVNLMDCLTFAQIDSLPEHIIGLKDSSLVKELIEAGLVREIKPDQIDFLNKSSRIRTLSLRQLLEFKPGDIPLVDKISQLHRRIAKQEISMEEALAYDDKILQKLKPLMARFSWAPLTTLVGLTEKYTSDQIKKVRLLSPFIPHQLTWEQAVTYELNDEQARILRQLFIPGEESRLSISGALRLTTDSMRQGYRRLYSLLDIVSEDKLIELAADPRNSWSSHSGIVSLVQMRFIAIEELEELNELTDHELNLLDRIGDEALLLYKQALWHAFHVTISADPGRHVFEYLDFTPPPQPPSETILVSNPMTLFAPPRALASATAVDELIRQDHGM